VNYGVKHTSFPLPFLNLGLRITPSFGEVVSARTDWFSHLQRRRAAGHWYVLFLPPYMHSF